MKRTLLAGAAAAAMLLTVPAAADTERQLDAHEHGHGTLNIAVEGKTLQMELEVPGADIVGFEHEASTDADKQSIETAKKTLSEPGNLVVFPAEAGCRVVSAEVSLITDEPHHDDKHDDHDDHAKKHDDHDDHDDHAKKHDDHDDHAKKHDDHDDHDDHAKKHDDHDDHDDHAASHSEFHAEYSFTCERIEAVTTVSFPYFKLFSNAQELDVTLVTDKGQTSFEVERDDAVIQVQGMM